ncbi:GNAT family N-acetyltransferase [Clostridium sp.]|jgi:hypothetical protein|uniref:GNAT family N-acetyltransferase n=1 Tax=Clostridium sp. TaxID=1506 RepID=UPI002585C9E6|nr:GNAT family N-acetyltransferase [Clostridium sp.]MDF2505443.1 hypothetical protein [Clostridium sp.]
MDNIIIHKLTLYDCRIWLNLAHESDKIVEMLIENIHTFYEGFDSYMNAKIEKNEAYMAIDDNLKQCMGIVAFSKTNNRITFLGVFELFDFISVGSKLIDFALNQLDFSKPISANVLKGDIEPLLKERQLYEKFGFVEHDNSIFEASVPACMLRLFPDKVR